MIGALNLRVSTENRLTISLMMDEDHSFRFISFNPISINYISYLGNMQQQVNKLKLTKQLIQQ